MIETIIGFDDTGKYSLILHNVNVVSEGIDLTFSDIIKVQIDNEKRLLRLETIGGDLRHFNLDYVIYYTIDEEEVE